MPAHETKSSELVFLFRKFINGSHILHYHNVLDAYGHLSFRNPSNPETFFMSRSIAPATIISSADIVEYLIRDASPANPEDDRIRGYLERYIHSEIYKEKPEVNAVVHSHSEAVVPYTISGVPLRPCYHMAGFLTPEGAPVYDVADSRREGKVGDLLVRDARLGASLAKQFLGDITVVLMRGHGFTAVGTSMEKVVFRAIYTQKNAAIQTAALTTRAAFVTCGGNLPPHAVTPEDDGLHCLSDEEAYSGDRMTLSSVQRPWELWVQEVEACGLYVNRG